MVSAASVTYIAANLLFWSAPLLVLAVFKALVPGGRAALRGAMGGIYRLAVVGDDIWLRRVLGLRWQRPKLPLKRDRSYVVLANHRSWMDVFVIQSLIARRGPIVKFLAKREVVYIPVVGLVCWAFDFPLLRRHPPKAGHKADRQRIVEACAVLEEAPGAMLCFVEGTRFTLAKRERQGRPYRHLLAPRPGGFAALCGAVRDTPIVDVTLHYRQPVSFWRLLGGGIPAPEVSVAMVERSAETGTAQWLTDAWRRKDAALVEAVAADFDA